MTKKKNGASIITAGIGFPGMGAYGYPERSDNNPASGLCEIPNENLNGCPYPENKVFFPGRVAAGESPKKPNVYTQTADGTSCAFGKGDNYEWDGDKNSDGEWNRNKPWPGGNRSGE